MARSFDTACAKQRAEGREKLNKYRIRYGESVYLIAGQGTMIGHWTDYYQRKNVEIPSNG